jgi:hypothetical protein
VSVCWVGLLGRRNAPQQRNVRKRGMVFTTQFTAKRCISFSNIGGRSMAFTIHAWKADQNVTTVRIGPAVAVDKARN